jgi:short subunit dehydrogenase-like uncharacterized protein
MASTSAAPRGAKRRDFDIVLYGATGFVGRQTVAYLAGHGSGLRWAVAGRSAAKLEALLADGGPGAGRAGLIVADAGDAAALGALAARSRVVLSTAGPFALYGSALVAACVEQHCHYVDITGETPWVKGLIDRHHVQARRDGTRIIPCCGFDSVPSDLGAWLLAHALVQQHGQRCAEVKACFSMRGGLNGGTLASALNMQASGQAALLADPFLLNPAGHRPADARGQADVQLPRHDADFDAWVGPFVMGPINTRVVRRSAALLGAKGGNGYGADFRYQEYQRFGRGGAAALLAAGASVAMASGKGAMALAPLRQLAAAVAPRPGQGPSQATMDGGWFRCDLVAHGELGQVLRGRIAGQGDPGNRATTRFVCEAALALAHGDKDLPGHAGTPGSGGVLTPASGLGAALVRRLLAAGMTIEPLP